jgi:FkbM family methyltransferase
MAVENKLTRIPIRTAILAWLRRAFGAQLILDRLDRIEQQMRFLGLPSTPLLDSAQNLFPDTSAHNPDALAAGARLAISLADQATYFRCELNGEPAWLPADTLRTMFHCLTVNEHCIVLWVETAHVRWMMKRLASEEGRRCFIDIGAATGAASIPIALKFKSNVSIIAFEPAANAMQLLRATLEQNDIDTVTLVNAAVADAIGKVPFIEYGHDPSGLCPYLPETSTIAYQGVKTINSTQTTVDCLTLDSYFSTDTSFHPSDFSVFVIKIDVEGFEDRVLKGAVEFIKEFRPFLSIDIHNRIDGQGTTEPICRDTLSRFGYQFQKIDHVLLASPELTA